ncbi:glyoxylate/hydroxypyruvate reductase A-like [Styela clava]
MRHVTVLVSDRIYFDDIVKQYETIFKSTLNAHVKFTVVPEEICLKDEKKISNLFSNAEIILLSDQSVSRWAHLISNNTKWIQYTWAGVEMLLQNDKYREILKEHIITRAGGIFGPSMAEYVIGAIVAMEKGFPRFYKQQMEAVWKSPPRCRNLSSLTIGILGLGDIGMHVARACSNFGMTVYGLKRTPSHCENVERVFTMDELPEILQLSDYICNILPSAPETKNILSGEMLQLCSQRKAKFINIGRGDVVDENILIKAIEKGWISEAFLDVFIDEPLDKSSPLWYMENVYITPHAAAEINWPKLVARLFFCNLQKYLNNQTLDYVVHWRDF